MRERRKDREDAEAARPKRQEITLMITMSRDFSDSRLWRELERLFMGYPSEIASNEILELEIVKHRSREGWETTT